MTLFFSFYMSVFNEVTHVSYRDMFLLVSFFCAISVLVKNLYEKMVELNSVFVCSLLKLVD